MINNLIENPDKIHTTEMGKDRIRRNMGLKDEDPLDWCRAKIMAQDAVMEKRGKNWYVTSGDCIITVNAGSYTVITAHRK